MLREMIFPLCEKLGQTIIFVRTKDSARSLHHAVRSPCLSSGFLVLSCSCSSAKAQHCKPPLS